MSYLLELVTASLLSTCARAHSPSQLTRFPYSGLVLMPKGFVENFKGVVPFQALTILNPLDGLSLTMIPHLLVKPDKSTAGDDMGWCVEAGGGRSGDVVGVRHCNGGPAQKWNRIPKGHGQSMLQLKDTNLCMDAVSEPTGLNGALIELRDCESKLTQSWKLEEPSPFPTPSSLQGFMPLSDMRHVTMPLVAIACMVALCFNARFLYAESSGMFRRQGDVPMSRDEEGGVSLISPESCAVIGRCGHVTMIATDSLLASNPDIQRFRWEDAVPISPNQCFHESLANRLSRCLETLGCHSTYWNGAPRTRYMGWLHLAMSTLWATFGLGMLAHDGLWAVVLALARSFCYGASAHLHLVPHQDDHTFAAAVAADWVGIVNAAFALLLFLTPDAAWLPWQVHMAIELFGGGLLANRVLRWASFRLGDAKRSELSRQRLMIQATLLSWAFVWSGIATGFCIAWKAYTLFGILGALVYSTRISFPWHKSGLWGSHDDFHVVSFFMECSVLCLIPL